MLTMLYEWSTCSSYLEDLVLLATKKQLSCIQANSRIIANCESVVSNYNPGSGIPEPDWLFWISQNPEIATRLVKES